jgi:hypothetical protein
MPLEKMQIDIESAGPEHIKEKALTALGAGVWLTPRAPEKVSSSFAPTEKTQSGEFSGIQQTDRTLPKFNAMKMNQHFSESKQICIGVRNPYALVNALRARNRLKICIWDEMKSPRERISNLMNPYLSTSITGEHLDFDQLFDPQYGSRLFDPKTLEKYHLVRCRTIGTAAVATGKTCTNATNWKASTVNWTAGPLPLYDAPRQGAADDCWFIAALSSIAWVLPDLLTADNSCGIFILDPNGPPAGQGSLDDAYLYPSDDLPLPPGAGSTSSSYWWSASKYSERWVAMMEKAFAMRYLDVNNDHPNVCSLPKGSPQFALYVLMGDTNWNMFWNRTPSLSTGATVWKDNNGNPIDAYGKLSANCNSPTGTAFKKTLFPTVAFTWDSALAPAPKLQNNGPLQYNTDLLVACHSYSVLGVYTEGGKNFVVLRNPWGLTAGVTYTNRTNLFGFTNGVSLAAGPLPNFAKRNGVYYNLSLWTSTTASGQLMDGIFALDASIFARYFHGFSWA